MLQALRPGTGAIYLDGTLGWGGYAEALLEASAPDGVVVGLDLDSTAVRRAGGYVLRGRANVYAGLHADRGDNTSASL